MIKILILAEMSFSGEMSSDLEIAVQYVDFILRWVRTSDAHTSYLYPYSYLYLLHALLPLFSNSSSEYCNNHFLDFLWQELTPNFGLFSFSIY